MTAPENDRLWRKYNVPGPRYTSYPTVPYWETSPTSSEWLDSVAAKLRETSSRGAGAALYVHIPFCESLCTYCGCNTRITRKHEVAAPYVQSVLREWELYRRHIQPDGEPIAVSEIHLGGGTPTFLTPGELERLVQGLLAGARLTDDRELSLEADPRVTTADHLAAAARLGFTRLSLGIQDFDPRVQEAVHRTQSEAQVRHVTETARLLGFTSVNYDLIYGLPFQTAASVQATVEAVVRLRPDRVAFYGYAHVPWIKPGQRRFTEADLPGGDEKHALYRLGRRLLEAAGYREIGMDHFALESDSLWHASKTGALHRNFMGYTSRLVAPLIGLGVSAIGDSWTAFAQNEKIVETYQERVARGELPILRGHMLGEEDLELRRHILNLMTAFETTWPSSAKHPAALDEAIGALDELSRDELVELAPDRCRVTEKGRPFLRNVCMAFDARLRRKAPEQKLFSRTV
jgi:oxygen-independent coproporphyrinogen-3 oxidase